MCANTIGLQDTFPRGQLHGREGGTKSDHLQRKGVSGEPPWFCILQYCDFLPLARVTFAKEVKTALVNVFTYTLAFKSVRAQKAEASSSTLAVTTALPPQQEAGRMQRTPCRGVPLLGSSSETKEEADQSHLKVWVLVQRPVTFI